MSFLVKAVNEIIKVIQEHMQEKLSLEQDKIPEAYLTNLIAKQKLSAELLMFEKQAEEQVDDEVDQLAMFLADLKLDLSKEKYLNQKLRFKDITWKDLMELDFKAFGGELINNLKSESVENRKLIIVARLRHRLYELTRQARVFLMQREEEINLEKIRVEEEQELARQMEALALEQHDEVLDGQEDIIVHPDEAELVQGQEDIMVQADEDELVQGQEDIMVQADQDELVQGEEEIVNEGRAIVEGQVGGVLEEVEDIIQQEQPKPIPACIDQWLFENAVAEIAQAEKLCETAESGERALVTFNSGGGKTKPLLSGCMMVVNETYELMAFFDKHEDHHFAPSSKQALRDFLPSSYRDHSPVVLAHLQGFHYILENLLVDAQIKSKKEKSFTNYLSLSGVWEYAGDTWSTVTHDSVLAKKKRSEVIKFFSDLTLKMDPISAKKYEKFLSTIDTFGGASDSMTYRKHLTQQALTVYYKTLHGKLMEQAPHSVSSAHKKKCSFH